MPAATSWPARPARHSQRQGSIVILSAIIITMLVVIAGVTINLTQLATAKSEIRMASDAAAKAGAIVLGHTQDVDEARRVAKQIASKHRVNGVSLKIRNSDILIGNSERGPDGAYVFQDGLLPHNSVRIAAQMREDGRTGPGSFYMSYLTPRNFQLHYQSTATRVDHDICLVIDRSGSMAWDLSGNQWQYPPSADGAERSIIQRYFEPPDPTASRWAALTRSTELFLEEVDGLPIEVQVGLVSYSSNFDFGLYHSDASTIESMLTNEYDNLQDAVLEMGDDPIIGNTNIASGMQAAVTVLSGEQARITAKATMIVLTDGRGNQGTDPVGVATAAAAANITVHTITFSDQADQATMQQVATAGGGRHYHAPDEAALRLIFTQLAQTLPAVLTN